MNAPFDSSRSKGMEMIAAYRAERLSQRPVLRASLRQSHAALRQTRDDGHHPEDAAEEVSPPPPPAADEIAASEPVSYISVFANLVSLEVAERLSEAAQPDAEVPEVTEPSDEPIDESIDESIDEAIDEPVADTEAEAEMAPISEQPAPEPMPEFDPPLAEIGFGPGMLIRFSQLGLHTTGELAQADPAHLRAELGDISRLVDVETWIAAALQKVRSGKS